MELTWSRSAKKKSHTQWKFFQKIQNEQIVIDEKDMTKSKRPFVFLCTGMSLDGKISNHKKECSPISSDDNRDMLFDARVEADAVMIGGNTLRLDDSGLTVKSEQRQNKRIASGKSAEPIKVAVIGDANDINLDGDFFNKGDGDKIVFTTTRTSKERIEEIKKKAKVHVLGDEKVYLEKAMEILQENGVNSVLVEGGGELIFSLLEKDLVDEIRFKIGNMLIGGRTSATPVDGEGFDILSARKVEFTSVVQEQKHILVRAKVIK
jgi:2,5-diamino-6-(ribosylamino)-4(3H)-pyrimidinone 5'-phosphate reductase